MPIYEFRCKKCGREVERMCKYDEREGQRCECSNDAPATTDDPADSMCDGELEPLIPMSQRTPLGWLP